MFDTFKSHLARLATLLRFALSFPMVLATDPGTIEIKRKIPSGQRVREGKRDASSELRVH